MISGRSKQKIRGSLKRILQEIVKTTQEAESANSPFDAAGSTDARFISAEGAYRHMIDNIDWDRVSTVISEVNDRSWRDEEYAKILTQMVTFASKIAAVA